MSAPSPKNKAVKLEPASAPAMSAPSPKIKAVNLGGWLVADGWIKPSLFDGIPNKDFLDGTQIHLKSVVTGKFIGAENGGGSTVVANRLDPYIWDTFKIWRVDADHFHLLANFSRHFVGLENGGAGVTVVATATTAGVPETFQIVRNPSNPNRVWIKSSNGLYWRVNSETSMTSEAHGRGQWGHPLTQLHGDLSDGDLSVFILTILYDNQLNGEYQVTKWYGSQASAVMESDFSDIKQKGLNAVRIPVGWWIASDPNPPKPYVACSLAALDNAFRWAEKYSLGVIIDLYVVPDAQNSDDHGGLCDGFKAWGDASIPRAVAVIDFLTKSALLGMELMNEPSTSIGFSTMTSYYRARYEAVRKYTSTAFVIMSSPGSVLKELLSFALGFSRCVVDVHCNNLLTPEFDKMATVQQNIDYIYNTRAGNLNDITVSNGPLIPIGEWVAEWNVPEATKAGYQAFAASQLDVFVRASFGWAYWTWKSAYNHWSLQWMIDNGYITLHDQEA